MAKVQRLRVITGGCDPAREKQRLLSTVDFARAKVERLADAIDTVIIITGYENGSSPGLVYYSTNEGGQGIVGVLERAKLAFLKNPGVEIPGQDDDDGEAG